MNDRQFIREYVVKKLKETKAVTDLVNASNISDSKATAWARNALPGINVVIQNQTGECASSHIPSFNFSIRLNVEIYVQTNDGWAAKADEIAEQVEKALFCDQTLGGYLVNNSAYDVEYSNYGTGEQPIAVEILSFSFRASEQYKPDIGDADDFDKMHLEVDVIEPIADPCPGPDGRIEFVIDSNFAEPQQQQESENENQTEPE